MKTTKIMLATLMMSSLWNVACSEKAFESNEGVSNQDENSELSKSFEQQFQGKLVSQGVTPDVAQQITTQALSTTNLGSLSGLSPDLLAAIAPQFLQGALTSNSALGSAALAQPIMSSFMSVLGGNLSGLNTSQLGNLFSGLGSTQVHILPVLNQSGLPLDQILQGLGLGFTSGLGQSGLPSNILQIALTQLPNGLSSQLPGIGAANGLNWTQLLGSFTNGSFQGIPALGASGLDLSMISQLLSSGNGLGLVNAGIGGNNLSSILSMLQLSGLNGATGQGLNIPGLANLLQGSSLGSIIGVANGGMGGSDLTDLVRMLTSGTVSGLPGMGFAGGDLSSLIGALASGTSSSLGGLNLNNADMSSLLSSLSMGGLSGLNLSGLQGNGLAAALQMLSRGSVAGLGSTNLAPDLIASLSQSGITNSMLGISLFGMLNGKGLDLSTLVQSITSGSMAGLGQTGLPLQFLQSGASNMAFGSFLGLLLGGVNKDNILGSLMPIVNQSAQTGLQQGGFSGNILTMLLGAVMNVTKDPEAYKGQNGT